MATLSTTLTLSSTTATSDALSISLATSLNITNPVQGLSRESVLHTEATILFTAADQTTDQYVYLKNTDSTNKITFKTHAGHPFAVLAAGESMIFCLPSGVGINGQAAVATCVLEYATFTKE
jgi:hypothetical protein